MKEERRYSRHHLEVYSKRAANYVSKSKFKHSGNFSVKHSIVEVSEEPDMDISNSLMHWTANHLSRKHRFYEVKFLSEVTKDQLVMIGLNPESYCKPVVWDKERSIRYTSVEGGVFTGGVGVRSDHPFGNEGDVITVYLEASYKKSSLINYFLNGCLVYRQWIDVACKHLYPTIGVSMGPANLEVTWPGQSTKPRLSCDVDKVHTLLNNWIGFKNIKKNDEAHTLEVTDHDHVNRRGYNIQAARPLDNENSYFEVELLTRVDPNMGPSIGLTSAWTSRYHYPGWKHDTIGYHCDEGSFYNDDGYKSSNEPDSSLQCQIGDRMGCGVVFSKKDHTECQMVTVYFTRNKEIVYVKPRMLPLGGFYPTVGLYEPGEKVRVENPCVETPVTLPNEEIEKIKPWERLYQEFKFHETISFDDFQASGSTRRISMNFKTKTAQMVHHVSVVKELYLMQFQVIELGSKSEIFIRCIPRCFTTTNRYVFNDITLKDVLCFSKNNGLKIGDKVFVTIQVNGTGLQITAIKDGQIVGQVFTANDGSPNWADQMPTIAFQNGRATLDVVWPGSTEFNNICYNKVSVTKYINEIMPTSDSRTSGIEEIKDHPLSQNEACEQNENENEACKQDENENEACKQDENENEACKQDENKNEACKQDENENEVRSLGNGNTNNSSNDELNNLTQDCDTTPKHVHYDTAKSEETKESNESDTDKVPVQTEDVKKGEDCELILVTSRSSDEESDDAENEHSFKESKDSDIDMDTEKVKDKDSCVCTIL